MALFSVRTSHGPVHKGSSTQPLRRSFQSQVRMAVSRNGDGRSRIGYDIDVMTSQALPKKKKNQLKFSI